MKVRIGSRKSDLARLQAHQVAEALQSRQPGLQVDFVFKSSLGDQNLNNPLWQMPEKGVFTADLSHDLVQGDVDLVVHSWKDLPIENSEKTKIYGTLPRADQRDLLIFKKSSFSKGKNGLPLQILTSSPRRVFHLSRFLPWALPFADSPVRFHDVRGNIPTRFRKLMGDPQNDGLVVAKAAIDRLLSSSRSEFFSLQAELREQLSHCVVMVLPLKECPAAAAQGALAIECRVDDPQVKKLVQSINSEECFQLVQKERRLLASHGGGCHQKIGISYFAHPRGTVCSLKGQTDSGETLGFWGFEGRRPIEGEMIDFFPKHREEANFFRREDLPVDLDQVRKSKFIFVAKGAAWPKGLSAQDDQVLWTGGLETWRQLAQQGHWVSGSSEGLGASQGPCLDVIYESEITWLKLTHEEAARKEGGAVGTYRLVANSEASWPSENVTHFFWTSYSHFKAAITLNPKWKSAWHACGPGASADLIQNELPARKLQVFISYDEWRDHLPRKK